VRLTRVYHNVGCPVNGALIKTPLSRWGRVPGGENEKNARRLWMKALLAVREKKGFSSGVGRPTSDNCGLGKLGQATA